MEPSIATVKPETKWTIKESLNMTHKLSPKAEYTHRIALCCQEIIDKSGYSNKKKMATRKEINVIAKKHNVDPERIDKIINYQTR